MSQVQFLSPRPIKMDKDEEDFEIIIDSDTVLPDDMTQEELEKLLIQLKEMADSGELFEMSEPVDFERLEEEDPELFALLTSEVKHTIN